MRATVALLANRDVSNWVRRLAWEIRQTYRTGTQHCRLPPHFSLKQPFRIASLHAIEAYLDEFAQAIEPFEVTLTTLQLVPLRFESTESGILWLKVQETTYLRYLQRRLNHEVSQRFGATQAAYDGSAYQFHMTVMLGGQPLEEYRRIYHALAEGSFTRRFTVHEVGLFVYDEPMGPQGEYMAYKRVPLGREQP